MGNRIPKRILDTGKTLGQHSTFYGVKYTEMSREELEAVAATGWYTASMLGYGEDVDDMADMDIDAFTRLLISTSIMWTLGYLGVVNEVKGAMNIFLFISGLLGFVSLVQAWRGDRGDKYQIKTVIYSPFHYIRDAVVVLMLVWSSQYVLALGVILFVGNSLHEKKRQYHAREALRHAKSAD